MIKIKAVNPQGLPFVLEIDGKKVMYEGFIENQQWGKKQIFPIIDKTVLLNLDPGVYGQWLKASTEKEVCMIMQADLIKDMCREIKEVQPEVEIQPEVKEEIKQDIKQEVKTETTAEKQDA